jgi:hypothetical protein
LATCLSLPGSPPTPPMPVPSGPRSVEASLWSASLEEARGRLFSGHFLMDDVAGLANRGTLALRRPERVCHLKRESQRSSSLCSLGVKWERHLGLGGKWPSQGSRIREKPRSGSAEEDWLVAEHAERSACSGAPSVRDLQLCRDVGDPAVKLGGMRLCYRRSRCDCTCPVHRRRASTTPFCVGWRTSLSGSDVTAGLLQLGHCGPGLVTSSR